MNPNPLLDLTQPSEARARTILDEGTGTPILVAGTGTILTPDPSARTGQVMTPDAFTPTQVQVMREAIAVIDGFSFQAVYGTPSEEADPEPTIPAQAPPPEPSGPPTHWSHSTVKGPVREATMMYSAPPQHTVLQASLGLPNGPPRAPFLIPSLLNLPMSILLKPFDRLSASGRLMQAIMDMPGW